MKNVTVNWEQVKALRKMRDCQGFSEGLLLSGKEKVPVRSTLYNKETCPAPKVQKWGLKSQNIVLQIMFLQIQLNMKNPVLLKAQTVGLSPPASPVVAGRLGMLIDTWKVLTNNLWGQRVQNTLCLLTQPGDSDNSSPRAGSSSRGGAQAASN